jgi:uncharacterized protein with PIN domain
MLEEERRDEPEAGQPAESRPAEEPPAPPAGEQPASEPTAEPQSQPTAESAESRPEPVAEEPPPAADEQPPVEPPSSAAAPGESQAPTEPAREGEAEQQPKRRGVPPPKDPEKGGYICDAMLGRLARELRMRGLDVFYQRNLGGMMAFRQSRQSGRTLLTRNHRLKGLPGVVSIESNNIREQVAQVTGEPVEPAPEPKPAEAEAPAVQPEADGKSQQAPVEPRPERPPERRQEQRREPRPPREHRPEQRREPRPEGEARPAPEPQFGRCLACNAPLEQVSRDTARPSIPFFIYQIHHDFRRCPKCKKVFWPGSHVQDMERRVRPQGRPPRRRGRR